MKIKLYTPQHMAAIATLKQNLSGISPKTQTAQVEPEAEQSQAQAPVNQLKANPNQTVPGVNQEMAKNFKPEAIAILKKDETEPNKPKIHFGSGKKDLNPIKHQENVKNFKAAIKDSLKKPKLPTKSLESRHFEAAPKSAPKPSAHEATDTVKTFKGNQPPKAHPNVSHELTFHEATHTATKKIPKAVSGPVKPIPSSSEKTAPLSAAHSVKVEGKNKPAAVAAGVKHSFAKKPSIFNLISSSFSRPVTAAQDNAASRASGRANLYRSEVQEGEELKK